MTLFVMNSSLFRQKVDLVRAIQKAEGYEACFKTGKAHVCEQNACLWREECLTGEHAADVATRRENHFLRNDRFGC